jgi:hypothetical protein
VKKDAKAAKAAKAFRRTLAEAISTIVGEVNDKPVRIWAMFEL